MNEKILRNLLTEPMQLAGLVQKSAIAREKLVEWCKRLPETMAEMENAPLREYQKVTQSGRVYSSRPSMQDVPRDQVAYVPAGEVPAKKPSKLAERMKRAKEAFAQERAKQNEADRTYSLEACSTMVYNNVVWALTKLKFLDGFEHVGNRAVVIAALREFQRISNLTAHGRLDPDTSEALQKATGVIKPPTLLDRLRAAQENVPKL